MSMATTGHSATLFYESRDSEVNFCCTQYKNLINIQVEFIPVESYHGLSGKESLMLEFEVREIIFDGMTKSYILILQDQEKEHTLPIWIGPFEAQSISMGKANQAPERPQTHDLFISLLDHLDVKVLSVVISKVEEGTFYASLHLLSDDSEFSIDARPSDAIAVALRAKAPIFVKEEILDQLPDAPDFRQLLDHPEESDNPES